MKPIHRAYILLLLPAIFWCSGIVMVPAFVHAGVMDARTSRLLYAFYGKVCHQLDARSFHVGGEKMTLCIRCTAIDMSFLAGILLLPLWRPLHRIPKPPAWWTIAAVLPMLLDVGAALAGVHESSPWTRLATGSIAGFALSWQVLPLFLDAILRLKILSPHDLPSPT